MTHIRVSSAVLVTQVVHVSRRRIRTIRIAASRGESVSAKQIVVPAKAGSEIESEFVTIRQTSRFKLKDSALARERKLSSFGQRRVYVAGPQEVNSAMP